MNLTSGCLIWREEDECLPVEGSCRSGECVIDDCADLDDACFEGEGARRCDVTETAVESCVLDPTLGCTIWQESEECIAPEDLCRDGECVDSRPDSCVDGATCATLARSMLDEVNADRTACGPFSWDDRLAAAAQECADAMAATASYSGCTDDFDLSLAERLTRQGLDPYAGASEVYGQGVSMRGAVDAWYAIGDTASYLNDCDFSLGGIGIALSADDRMWFCFTLTPP